MRFLKWRIEKAEYVDDLEEIEYRFGAFLCEMTGNRLSKTNYPLGVMVSYANDYQQEICEECRDEQQGEWQDGHCTNCYHQAEVRNIGFNCKGDDLIIHYKHTNYCPNCGAKMDGTVSKTEIVEDVKK